MNARIDDGRWIRCGKCGHKLGRVLMPEKGTPALIEIKCSSCKELNIYAKTLKKGD